MSYCLPKHHMANPMTSHGLQKCHLSLLQSSILNWAGEKYCTYSLRIFMLGTVQNFLLGGLGGLGYGWGSGKSGIWIKSFCMLSFQKKFRPANSHEDPNLTMHWHRQPKFYGDSEEGGECLVTDTFPEKDYPPPLRESSHLIWLVLVLCEKLHKYS